LERGRKAGFQGAYKGFATMDVDGTKYRTFHKGQSIFKEGQKGSVAYMLKHGKVTLYRSLNNKRVVLARIEPGQMFGEEGLLTDEGRIANAEAEESCELIVIDQDVFQTMLLKSPGPIQRLTRKLMEQVKIANARISERPAGNIFTSVCAVLDLAYRAGPGSSKAADGSLGEPGLSYAEFLKKVKEILLVTRLEVDDVLGRLAKLEIIEIMELKDSVMSKDEIGRVRKTSEFLRDRRVVVKDLDKFMQVARNLSEETYAEKPPFTECLEFIDIHDFAELVHSTPEMIYKKIGYKEFPENYFFLHKPTVEAWAAKVGEEFFQKVKRKRVRIEDLETVDDIVYVDNATLQDAFSRVGFHKMGILAGMAGDEARKKIFANLSKKIAKVVEEEARAIRELDEMEAADAEDELLAAVKSIKGLTK